MVISGIDAFKQALMAQQFGAQLTAGTGSSVGATKPVTPESVTGAGTESSTPAKFNWKNLNKFDGHLTGTAPQTGIGKTSEVPSENIFTQGISTAYEKPQTGLFESLNRIDARDIALNSNKNGLDGQRYINFLA